MKFLIFLICVNLYFCFIRFNKYENEFPKESSSKHHLTLEEFDKLMSKFSEAWKKFKETGLNNLNDNIYSENKLNENIFSDDNNDSTSCLLPKERTIEILKNLDKNYYNNDNPSDEIRFIFGNCNPIILIHRMFLTR